MGRWVQLVVALAVVSMPNQVQCLISCASPMRPASAQAAPACHHHGGSEKSSQPCPKTRLISAAVFAQAPPAAPPDAARAFIARSAEEFRNSSPREIAQPVDSSPPGSQSSVLRI